MTIKKAIGAQGRIRRVLRPREAADYIGLAESTLAKRRLYGGGNAPPFIALGGRAIGYLQDDLDDWLERQRRSSTSDVGEAA